jgi:hypothetical protein
MRPGVFWARRLPRENHYAKRRFGNGGDEDSRAACNPRCPHRRLLAHRGFTRMNEISQIIITEEAARSALAAAIAARSEAQKHFDAALSKDAEARAKLDEREEAFKRAHGIHQEAIDKGATDADIIRTLHKADEAKALTDAARAVSERAATHLGSAKYELAKTKGAVDSASGQVLAAIAQKEVADFREGWREMIRASARLYALRARCTTLRAPVPPELLDRSIDAAASDSAFPAFYRHSRDDIAGFLGELANDPQAPFDLKE